MNENIIYESGDFVVFVPKKPHIPREDGGHLVICSKEKFFSSRLDLSPEEAISVMRLSLLVSEAMMNGMRNRGVNIARMNYQENGNWSYLVGDKPFFHLHLYGRCTNAKTQEWGEALVFPDKDSTFYDTFEPFNEEDIEEIVKEIKHLETLHKYSLDAWKLS